MTLFYHPLKYTPLTAQHSYTFPRIPQHSHESVHRSWVGFGSYIFLMTWNLLLLLLLLRAVFMFGNRKKKVGWHMFKWVRWVADHYHPAGQQEALNYWDKMGRALCKRNELPFKTGLISENCFNFQHLYTEFTVFLFMHKSFVDHTMLYKNDQHLFDSQLLQVMMMFPTPCYNIQDCAETFKPCLQ